MADYKKLYHKAYNAITDVERLTETAATMLSLRTAYHLFADFPNGARGREPLPIIHL